MSLGSGQHVVEILSPVPPTRTGPADYLQKVVEQLSQVPGAVERIVVGADFSAGTPDDAALPGVAVVDYRSLATEVPIGRTRIYALANNSHHAFVHGALEALTRRSHGRVIGLVHDPSLFMVHRWRTGVAGEHGLAPSRLESVMKDQYGEQAGRLLDRRLRGEMPDIFEYVTSAQSTALLACHELWTHSLFAAAKLVFESDLTTDMLPRMRVCRHPQGAAVAGNGAGQRERATFRIGCFGWISGPKRVDAVISGLALAMDRLPSSARDVIQLSIVGNQADEDVDILARAASLGLSGVVELIVGAPRSEFEARQRGCDLVFNLRYPSCGETSGTFASAVGGPAEMVVSRYQSFNELAGVSRGVTTLPGFDVIEIASVICRSFAEWREDEARGGVPEDLRVASVDRLILTEIVANTIGLRLRES